MRTPSLDIRATARTHYVGIKSFCNPSPNGGAQDLALLCSLLVGGLAPSQELFVRLGSEVGSSARFSHPELIPPYWGG